MFTDYTEYSYKESKRKGRTNWQFSNYSIRENIIALMSLIWLKISKLYLLTKRNDVFVDGSEFETNRKTVAATKLGKDDELVSVVITRVSEKEGRHWKTFTFTRWLRWLEMLDYEQMNLLIWILIIIRKELQYTREICALQINDVYS